ncbi:hypothetical protein FCOL_05375 [Flavobacterium columnare ATCC 49512]|uniref:Uncharacterized protein n=1 Tax=Flavobacterium columnare (strain ATCC 49512 / CIP 103533 / TG 44/87) TaxID=1041826 RepID=G8X9F3_FLACA|nr:hypothetical protein [Flavobacterium columnare]AEW85900.1 hypothetical protein FCOL_05375 [Flavobacterium columnare ATCC 49512]
MNLILDWFSRGCPYNDGVALYATVKGYNAHLLRNFQKKETALLLEKLKYELRKHLATAPVPVVKKEVVPPLPAPVPTVQVSKTNSLFFHELPEALRPVLLQANTLFKEMCLLKVQLNELPIFKEKEALALQLDISMKRKANALCWKKIDYWKTHKLILEEKATGIEALSPEKKVLKRQHLYASISKLTKRIADNEALYLATTNLKERNVIDRKLVKQKANLLEQQTDLQRLNELING